MATTVTGDSSSPPARVARLEQELAELRAQLNLLIPFCRHVALYLSESHVEACTECHAIMKDTKMLNLRKTAEGPGRKPKLFCGYCVGPAAGDDQELREKVGKWLISAPGVAFHDKVGEESGIWQHLLNEFPEEIKAARERDKGRRSPHIKKPLNPRKIPRKVVALTSN